MLKLFEFMEPIYLISFWTRFDVRGSGEYILVDMGQGEDDAIEDIGAVRADFVAAGLDEG